MCSVNHENGRYPNFLLTAKPTHTKLECKVFSYGVFNDGEGTQNINGNYVQQVLSIVQLFANYYDYVRRNRSKTLLPHINFVSAKSLQKNMTGEELALISCHWPAEGGKAITLCHLKIATFCCKRFGHIWLNKCASINEFSLLPDGQEFYPSVACWLALIWVSVLWQFVCSHNFLKRKSKI